MLQTCVKENKETIILSDFNVDYLQTGENNEVKSILQLYGYKQIVKKAARVTYESSALIDLITTNNTASILGCDVFPTYVSDHDMVGCIRKINHLKFIPKIIVSELLILQPEQYE